jgi:hypothetical protein
MKEDKMGGETFSFSGRVQFCAARCYCPDRGGGNKRNTSRSGVMFIRTYVGACVRVRM